MLAADLDYKQFFFTAENVRRELDKATVRTLSRQGAFVQRTARSSLKRPGKKGGNSAQPGKPPKVHSRSAHATLKKILFGYNPDTQSVFIGPVGIGKPLRGSSAGTVAQLMEQGGTATIRQRDKKKKNDRGRSVRARYAQHPFMGPALKREIEAGNIAEAWSRAIN